MNRYPPKGCSTACKAVDDRQTTSVDAPFGWVKFLHPGNGVKKLHLLLEEAALSAAVRLRRTSSRRRKLIPPVGWNKFCRL